MSNDDCCPTTAPAKSTSDSACCTLASANYKADDYTQPQIALPRLFDVPPFALLFSAIEPVKTVSHVDNIDPPLLNNTWQFVFRAALLPRAPSQT